MTKTTLRVSHTLEKKKFICLPFEISLKPSYGLGRFHSSFYNVGERNFQKPILIRKRHKVFFRINT